MHLAKVEPQPLSSLLLRVRRVLALNFPDGLWIRAELSQVSERRGHRYLDLTEQGDTPSPVARAQAVLWSRTYNAVVRKRGKSASEVLVAGQEVSLLVEVDYHEVYGFKLRITDWDPAFTLGQIEIRRRQIVETLLSKGLLRRNGGLPLPTVPQRIAVLSSAAAAGYADFQQQLRQNGYGYAFSVKLFDVAVQGDRVNATVVSALEEIDARAQEFDIVAILRGGGSRLDLASFDELEIGEAIAKCQLPVFVGIGHETDETLPDLVAHTSLKTPTALAEHIIALAANFEHEQLILARKISQAADRHSKQASQQLSQVTLKTGHAVEMVISTARAALNEAKIGIKASTKLQVQAASADLNAVSAALLALDPAAILARGYASVSRGDKRIISAKHVTSGDRLELRFADGRILTKAL